MKPIRWLLPAACAVALVAAAPRGPEPPAGEPVARDEAKVKATLEGYWDAFVRQDAVVLRDELDLPLALLEQSDDGRTGDRFVITQRDWPAYARLFRGPLADDKARYEIQSLRLEWLGDETALAVYELAGESDGQIFGGRFLTILVWRDGWRVAVTSIPM